MLLAFFVTVVLICIQPFMLYTVSVLLLEACLRVGPSGELYNRAFGCVYATDLGKYY